MMIEKNYIIAEMACSHEGNMKLAKQIIDTAGKSGADAIQFQIWKLDQMMVPDHKDYSILKNIEISYDNWVKLSNYVRKKYSKMDIIGCVNEKSSVAFCDKLKVDAYKIHSSDLSNLDLIEYIAKRGKRIDLSVGASTLEEIQRAVECIGASSNVDIWLMYGYQNFPTKIDKINLAYMKKLQDLFELPVGYQDHTDPETDAAFWLPAFALGKKINIIEKHITHDRSYKGIDHHAALNPDEFLKFVEMIRTLELADGVSVPRPFSEEEEIYRKYCKKSIVAANDLKNGKNLTKKDLFVMRANELGLSPDKSNLLIGKKIKKDLKKYEILTIKDVL